MRTGCDVVVCTLFEGNYHHGVACLANSLYANNFRGIIYVGFRGKLPAWTASGQVLEIDKWNTATVLDVTADLQLIFLALDTEHHLTNYKPDFMLELLDGPASSADAIFYFDPDIVVAKDWLFFQQWVSCGVALCEDINSPIPANHPRRIGWRRYFANHGLPLIAKGARYVNGGAIGIRREHSEFLETWQRFNELMGQTIGGLSVTRIVGGNRFVNTGFANCFDIADQDALNASTEACISPLTIIGQEAMGFKPGVALLPHALGPGKPWERSYLKSAVLGYPPRLVDKLYWNHAIGPIRVHSKFRVKLKRIAVKVGSFIGRFYIRR